MIKRSDASDIDEQAGEEVRYRFCGVEDLFQEILDVD
jgi:hypothetical protein